MAATISNMLPIGTVAPPFTLEDTVSERIMSLEEIKSDKATVIMFICNHCPYVKHLQPELVKLAEDYIPEGVKFAAISSNNIEDYPEDSPELMQAEARKWGYPFPYLYDETQAVARAYDAACTPDFYIFDGDLKLLYRGQFDDSRPGNEKPADGKDIRNALDDILRGNPVTENQRPSQGCGIKWKK